MKSPQLITRKNRHPSWWRIAQRYSCRQAQTIDGYALPMSLALGLIMITLGLSSVLIAQDDRNTAVLRQETAASVLMGDSAIAQILSHLSSSNLSLLLGRNYDPINPDTGKTYLGADGIPNSNDENSNAVDEWNNYTPKCLSAWGLSPPSLNFLGDNQTYKLVAYRHDPSAQQGHLLIEGIHEDVSSYVYLSITLDSYGFPGMIANSSMYWQGREISGKNGNVVFLREDSSNTSLTDFAAPGDATRSDYLDAIWTGSSDGFSDDRIQGTIGACTFSYSTLHVPQGEDLGIVTSSQSLSARADQNITHFRMNHFDLSGNDEITVDTTAGRVHLYVDQHSFLRESAKIRNVRSDGLPPRVGDLRLISINTGDTNFVLYGTSCIDTAFIYNSEVDLQLLTTGEGCGSGSNSNINGVVWVEDVINSVNNDAARDFDDGGDFEVTTNNVTSGIRVPDEVSSLLDMIKSENLPMQYRIRSIQAWERIQL